MHTCRSTCIFIRYPLDDFPNRLGSFISASSSAAPQVQKVAERRGEERRGEGRGGERRGGERGGGREEEGRGERRGGEKRGGEGRAQGRGRER